MRKRWWLIVPAALLLASLGYWVWVVNDRALRSRNTLFEYHVPGGFSGWITIKYGVPGAPPLPFVSNQIVGTYTLRIPSSGTLETSSPVPGARPTGRYFRSERGGSVLIAWVPPPFFLREDYTSKCTLIYVPASALPPGQDAPPYPDNGCH